MLVVSDTTTITTLVKSGDEIILERLFSTIHVPAAIWTELLEFHAELPSFIQIHSVTYRSEFKKLEKGLGAGEREAITLALELKAGLFLSDDRKAISAARKMSLESSGLIGVAIEAKAMGLIASVREFVQRLETRGGLYVSDAVKESAFKKAGE